jgi:hypothetical protein
MPSPDRTQPGIGAGWPASAGDGGARWGLTTSVPTERRGFLIDSTPDPLDAAPAGDLPAARRLVVRRAEAVAELRACAASLAGEPARPGDDGGDRRVRAAYRQLLEAQLVLAGLPVIDGALIGRAKAAEALVRAAGRTDRWATIGFAASAVAGAAAALWSGPEVVLGVLTIGLGLSFKTRHDAEEDRRQAESERSRTLTAAGLPDTTTAAELRQAAERRRAATDALDAAVATCAALDGAGPAGARPVEAGIAADAWEELVTVDAALWELARTHGLGVRHPGDVAAALEGGDGGGAPRSGD